MIHLTHVISKHHVREINQIFPSFDADKVVSSNRSRCQLTQYYPKKSQSFIRFIDRAELQRVIRVKYIVPVTINTMVIIYENGFSINKSDLKCLGTVATSNL